MTTLALHAARAATTTVPHRAQAIARVLARLNDGVRARAERCRASLDLDPLPDRLRADIGLPPLGECPSRIVPPIAFGRL